jgi:hypothetical protein
MPGATRMREMQMHADQSERLEGRRATNTRTGCIQSALMLCTIQLVGTLPTAAVVRVGAPERALQAVSKAHDAQRRHAVPVQFGPSPADARERHAVKFVPERNLASRHVRFRSGAAIVGGRRVANDPERTSGRTSNCKHRSHNSYGLRLTRSSRLCAWSAVRDPHRSSLCRFARWLNCPTTRRSG